ncbi:LEGL protein, partial [Polyodon spathula]|nr:LEGL protein [Polyodon spathula]
MVFKPVICDTCLMWEIRENPAELNQVRVKCRAIQDLHKLVSMLEMELEEVRQQQDLEELAHPQFMEVCITPNRLKATREIEGPASQGYLTVTQGRFILFHFSRLVRIAVNLACNSKDPKTDVGLQLSVSFQDRSVVRNARICGEWGAAEKNIPYFPFSAGETFKMEILCEHQQFQVMMDGQPLCGFAHRIQELPSLTALKVWGDMQLTKVA